MGQEMGCELSSSFIEIGPLIICDIGDITSVNVFGQCIVVLNSCRVASDLLDKWSSIYSNRPVLTMAKLYIELVYALLSFDRFAEHLKIRNGERCLP
jgi:hypothetical protein